MNDYKIKTNGTFKKVKDYKHVTNVSAYSLEELEKRGITDLYQVIKPEITSSQRYGEEVIDEEKKTITYSVVDIPKPSIEDLATEKRAELRRLSHEILSEVQFLKSRYDLKSETLPQQITDLINTMVTVEEEAKTKIVTLESEKKFDELNNYQIKSQRAIAFLNQLKSM